MSKVFLPDNFMNRIKKSEHISSLKVEEAEIRKKLELELIFPYRNNLEIIALKKQKFVIQCRINMLTDERFKRAKQFVATIRDKYPLQEQLNKDLYDVKEWYK